MKSITMILFLLALWSPASFAKDENSLIVVPRGKLDQYWTIKKVVNPGYPRVLAKEGVEGCAAIGFVIESNGRPSGLRPIAGYPSDEFLGQAMVAIKQWKFSPSEANTAKQPVFTHQIIEFNLGKKLKNGDTDQESPEDNCTEAVDRYFSELSGDASANDDPVSPPISASSELQCREEEQDIARHLESLRACETVDDCMLLSGSFCPFGCDIPVNRNNEQLAIQAIGGRSSDCPECMYRCTGDNQRPLCKNHQCTVAQDVSAESVQAALATRRRVTAKPGE